MIDRKLWHKSIMMDAVMASCRRRRSTLDDGGFCLGCGQECQGIEPDARGYKCEACGEKLVFGDEEILMELL